MMEFSPTSKYLLILLQAYQLSMAIRPYGHPDHCDTCFVTLAYDCSVLMSTQLTAHTIPPCPPHHPPPHHRLAPVNFPPTADLSIWVRWTNGWVVDQSRRLTGPPQLSVRQTISFKRSAEIFLRYSSGRHNPVGWKFSEIVAKFQQLSLKLRN